MRYLLDTDTVIFYLRGRRSVMEQIARHTPDTVAISTITLYEILVGLEKSIYSERAMQVAETFIESVSVLPWDDRAARYAARTRAYLEKQGNPIGPIDYLIAGVALANDTVLVTHNTAEFSRVPDLQIEDWF